MNQEQRMDSYLRNRTYLTDKQRRRLTKKYWRDLLAGVFEEDYDPCYSCGGPQDHSEAGCQGEYF